VTAGWWRVRIECADGDRDAIAAAMVALTGQGVEEIDAHTLATAAEDELGATELIASLQQAFPGAVASTTQLAPVDWTLRWRDGIVTRRLGRLVLTPSWLPVSAAVGEAVITIDPESAFGSGEHGSTRGALALLERHVRTGDAVLDLGSGSGILAIAAVLLGARHAIGIEVDEESQPIAHANARKNGVADRVTFVTGDAGVIAPLAGPANIICSNILRNVNTELLPAIAAALTPGGHAIFAGMEDAESAEFLPALAQHGWTVVDTARDAGWWSVAARQ
jgi:ribosomal protein L11 methyltransferase